MSALADSPLLFLPVSFCVLVLSTWLGRRVRHRRAAAADATGALSVTLTATLTLLALIIGFAFSMAVARYDLRKNYEEAEANAIGTEYSRAGLLPAAEASRTRKLLEAYLEQRILFYETRDASRLRQIDAETARLQDELWGSVATPANGARDSMLMALVVSGMNDTLNSQSYTQSAWWNRIPSEAWALMMLIGILGTALFGYSAHGVRGPVVLTVLPLVVSLAFFLIADIDSPRNGLVHVAPLDLRALAASYAHTAKTPGRPEPQPP